MDTWVIAVISLIGSTALSTLVGLLIKNSVAKKVDEQKELFELREKQEKLNRKQEFEEVLETQLGPISNKLDDLSNTAKTNTKGTVTLLRESLKQARDHLLAKGIVSASEVASWHELYNTYQECGGNHFKEYVNAWKADIDGLPRENTKKQDKE